MVEAPAISVIIPTWRALDCLKVSLPEFLRTPDCEVIVGLDGIRGDFLEYLRPLPVKLSATQRRQGVCTATNLAARLAAGRHLFLCNDDMVPAPGWERALLQLAADDRIVSGTCWEPGLIAVPPPFLKRDFGSGPENFRRQDFFDAVQRDNQSGELSAGPGINYPFLIPREMWQRAGGLDERFNPGPASDPDLFIRLALLDPAPQMIRTRRAILYHFSSRSSSFSDGRISYAWKFHRRHSMYIFRRKWDRPWEHQFGQVPDISAWKTIVPQKEPPVSGKFWRWLCFGPAGRHIIET